MATIIPPDSERGSGYYLFGRDIMSIPCFRMSGLIGCSTMIGTMLTHFMFTSRPFQSVGFGFKAFSLVTFPYWMVCRFNYHKTEAALDELKHVVKRRTNDNYYVLDSLQYGPDQHNVPEGFKK